jgi:DNA polymerase
VGQRLKRKLHFDYESRGSLNLEDVGVDVYFSHPETDLIILAYAFDDGPVEACDLTKDPLPQEVKEAFVDPDVTKCAWNASFERTGTDKKLGIFIPFEQWEDPSVGARYLSMPGKLERVGEIVDLPPHLRKNEAEGASLRHLFTEPRRVKLKKEAVDTDALFAVSPLPDRVIKHTFADRNTHPKEWAEFIEYCRQDVVAERAIGRIVGAFPLTPTERRMYALDQKINYVGFMADKVFATNCFELAARDKKYYVDLLKEKTHLENPNSNPQMMRWVQARGYPFNSLRKEPVNAALTDPEVRLTEECRDVLSKLKYSKKTSYTKLEAITLALGPDDRLRDQFLFLGSPRAGRWAGRNVQLQNMARPIKALKKEKDLLAAMDLVRSMDYDGLHTKFPKDPVIDVMTSLIRSAFVAAPGNRLDVGDLNAIENRVLGWVADEQKILDVFRRGQDPYLDFATKIWNIPYLTLKAAYDKGDPDADEKRQIAKPAVLGAGYRLSGGDWKENKYGDRVKGGLWGYAENMHVTMSKKDACKAVAVFREEYKKVVQLWYDCENAVARCLRSGKTEWMGPTHLVWCGRRKMKNGKFMLVIHLPSGRCLHYLEAWLDEETKTSRAGNQYTKYTMHYSGINQDTKTWGDISTHGGKLVENIVQAISRDILVEAMLRADELGLRIVAHIHDEIVSENLDTPDGMGLDDLLWCLSQTPDWAPNLPLTAAGYSGTFYRKG